LKSSLNIATNNKITTAVPLIMLMNIGVFFLWLSLASNGEDSPFMVRHFLVSWSALEYHRYWTALTSVFSHNLFWHLFLNMYVLGSFGDIVEEALGTWRFVTFYLIAGVISSLSHSLISAFLLNEKDLSALGASGAISGVIVVFAFLYPRDRIYLFGLIPIPAAWGAALFIGLDLWGLIRQSKGGGLPIGHGAHLGGAFAGAVYFLFYLRGKLGANLYDWRHSTG
jgi:membrane associated rhomboid family serine protease